MKNPPLPIEELDIIEEIAGIPCIKKEHLQEHFNKVQLIDVRTQKEFEAGSIPGALHIPMGEALQSFLDEEKNREKTLVFYCHKGGRSGKATQLSRQKGFQKTFSLFGGFLNWN